MTRVSKQLLSLTLLERTLVDGEDSRTALTNASACIKSLLALARGNATSPISSTGGSSSAPAVVDIDRQRIEMMTKLVSILQRNIRVRFELNVPDVMQA